LTALDSIKSIGVIVMAKFDTSTLTSLVSIRLQTKWCAKYGNEI